MSGEELELEHVRRRLGRDLGDRASETEIDSMVSAAIERLSGARVRRFVPLLVDRSVRRQLRHRPRLHLASRPADEPPRVLGQMELERPA